MCPRSWSFLVALLWIFTGHKVDGSCKPEHISSTCEYNIHCINDINGLVDIWLRLNCPTGSSDDMSIHLYLNNVDLDFSWTYNERDNINTDKIKWIKLIHMDKIPIILHEFSQLEEIAVTDWLEQTINLNRFLDLKLNKLIKINVSHGNIENLETKFVHFFRDSTRVENIDLSHNLLEKIPFLVFNSFSSKLKHLNLSHNLIKTIHAPCFGGIENLETLDLSFNRLLDIGQSFVMISNLKELYLQNNNISSIYETDFNALVDLEKLNLNSNAINTIEDDAFRALGNLKEVDLSNNKLITVSKVLFWSNTKIYQLLLANNKIQNIESDAFKGKSITSFDIKGNDLSGSLQSNSFKGISTDNLNLSNFKINAIEAAAFAGLQTQGLDLSNNIIKTIDAKSFRGIDLLTEFDLSNNNLTRIDFETEDMRHLLVFKARNNQIANVSQMSLKNFVALTTLDLSYNKIRVLDPKLFFDLHELKFLDLSNNLLSGSLQANFFQGLSALTNIQLANNRFTNMNSEAFSGLNSLKILNCTSGELTNIHFDAFNNTGSLEILDLSRNLLDSFTVNFKSITSVKELYLNDNNIHNVTKETVSCINSLEKLYFSNNNIIVLDSQQFRELKNLKVLDLSNNPIIDSVEVLSNLSYLAELKLSNIKNQFKFESLKNVSITYLDLSRNNIDNLNHVFVFKINDIHYLDLKINKIAYVDKDSFKNMYTLMSLDLSFNLITYIQPGTFLQTKGLKSLNLHENDLTTLQYGALNGLYDLETLNLSSNAIHEFRKTLLINTPKISTIALDNNVIEHIKFEEFVPSNIKLMTIGGNPISCHVIAQFIERNLFNVSAEILDHHNESIHGIRCISNTNVNINSYENTNDGNITAASWMIYKEFGKNRAILEKILGIMSKINLENDSKENKNTQQSIISLLKSINESQNNTNNYLKLQTNTIKIDTIEEILRKINGSEKMYTTHDTNISDKNEIDYQLQEKIKILNEEKDKIVKEMLEIIEEFKNSKDLKLVTDFSHNNNNEFDDLKGVLYFVAICLVILILFIVVAISLKYFRPRYSLFKRSNEATCSTQQMANIIELQEN